MKEEREENCPWCGLTQEVMLGLGELSVHIRNCALRGRGGTIVAEGKICSWVFTSDGCWSTTCGRDWGFEDGGPTEHGVDFCMGCGKKVVVDKTNGPDEFGEYVWEGQE